MNVLNLFITFGDTFLPSPSCYDELYYEIVRMNVVFDNLYSLSKLFESFVILFLCLTYMIMNSMIKNI